MSYKDKADELYRMIDSGQAMEAFEKFYADNVKMIEANGDTREGKDKNREFQKEWFSSVQDMHGAGVNSITSNEDQGVTMVESWMDVSFKDGSRMKMEEVARQKWEGDKIVEERFYYHS